MTKKIQMMVLAILVALLAGCKSPQERAMDDFNRQMRTMERMLADMEKSMQTFERANN